MDLRETLRHSLKKAIKYIIGHYQGIDSPLFQTHFLLHITLCFGVEGKSPNFPSGYYPFILYPAYTVYEKWEILISHRKRFT